LAGGSGKPLHRTARRADHTLKETTMTTSSLAEAERAPDWTVLVRPAIGFVLSNALLVAILLGFSSP
jgi:hypothetical protein